MDAILLATVFLVPGLIAVFIPIFPAALYSFVIIFIYAITTHFTRLHGWEFAALAFITVLAIVNDQLTGLLGAKYGGASAKALAWGFFGAIVGTVLAGPLGSFIGLFLAITVAELSQFRTQQAALRAATGGVIGALLSYIINIVLVFLMVGLFLVFVLK